MAAGSLRLPERCVLLHIGPFKTGTTAIQGALFRARPQLAEHGVLHAGRGRDTQPLGAVLALRGVKPLVGDPQPRLEAWTRLVQQVAAAADKRVVVSSEFFADGDTDVARRAVHDLGAARVHVVVTLRPLTKIMPSQWQQYIRNRATFSYDDWLDGMLNKAPYTKPTPTFWQRNRHDVLVERWASVVGPQNLTVVVLDEADRGFLLRTFEDLVGLPRGFLVAVPNSENRSLTFGEIELIRQVNAEFRRRGWSDDLYKQLVREGLGARMQRERTPGADEPRITTPRWALERAAEIGTAAAEKLSMLGVRIVGDVSSLGSRSGTGERDDDAVVNASIAVGAARDAVIGTILASGVLTQAPLVESTSTVDLARTVLARVRRRARRAVRRAAGGRAVMGGPR